MNYLDIIILCVLVHAYLTFAINILPCADVSVTELAV